MLPPRSERIHQARRAAHVAGLVSAGWPEATAEQAIAAWEAQATAESRLRGSPAFWTGCEAWLAERRRRSW